ncbi:MAG: hypothetical protein WBB38_16015 [Hyphomicrobiaceae bacterium]
MASLVLTRTSSHAKKFRIRPFYEMADFGEAVTPELAAKEQRLREKLKGR